MLQARSKGRAKFNLEKLSVDTFPEGRDTDALSLTFYFLVGAGSVEAPLSSTAVLPKDQDGALCAESSKSEKKFLARLLISIYYCIINYCVKMVLTEEDKFTDETK